MKILINRKTIKRNPNAGQTVFYVQGQKIIKFSCHTLPEQFIDGVNCIIGSHEIQDGIDCNYQGIITDVHILNEYIKKEKGLPNGLSVTMTHNPIQIKQKEPDPDWLYDYKPTKVTCKYCKETFNHTELDCDSIESDDYYSYSETVCPKCDRWDCCELEYEDIKDALKK